MVVNKHKFDFIGSMLALTIMFLVSAQEIRSQLIFYTLRNVALSIDNGEALEPDGWKVAVLTSSLLPQLKNCDSGNISSGLSVLLKDVDRSMKARSDQDEVQYKVMRSFFSHALNCSPAEGNVWIRYALIENVFSRDFEKVASMAHMSNMLSPSSKSVNLARSELFRK